MRKEGLFNYFVIILILALIGFADATYLTASHYLEEPAGCGLEGGCEAVTSSQYSILFGIPISLFGLLYYLTVIGLSVFWFDKRNPLVPKLILAIVSPAFLFSAWLVYLMLFVLQAICWWCAASATVTTLMFILTTYVNLKR